MKQIRLEQLYSKSLEEEDDSEPTVKQTTPVQQAEVKQPISLPMKETVQSLPWSETASNSDSSSDRGKDSETGKVGKSKFYDSVQNSAIVTDNAKADAEVDEAVKKL